MLGQYRLVTVAGPGGVGKTRLADEVLKQVASRFADGVAVVELAGLQEPALVPAMVATVLGLRQASGTSVVDALVEHLSRQQLLLVLDNCEHLLDSVAQFCSSALLAADDIRILATSREPLGLAEEARYRLRPLTLPAPDASREASPAEAITLFVQRARQSDPDFALDSGSGPVVEQLVRRLDGMPLAIELAAARVEALGLTQMLDRLDDRFRLLVSTHRGVTARQRSLEAAVDWSYQLLTAAEQRVFRALAVFPGSFTLEAAEAVVGADAGPAVLRLVDCSLLVPPQPGRDGRSRYAMLETLRDYGLGRLRQSGEVHQAASGLALYAQQAAERAADQMASPDEELSAARWLDAEEGAAHQALVWALDHDRPTALRLAVALAPWWLMRGRWIQGSALLQRAIEQTDPTAGPWYPAHIWLGRLADQTFNPGLALRHFDTALSALQDSPPSPELIESLAGRAGVLRNMKKRHLAEATADAQTALELARQTGYAPGEAMALVELSIISFYADDSDAAVEWARRAHQVDRSRMPGWCAREVECALPFVLVACGQLDGAVDLLNVALAQARTVGDLTGQADALFLMAMVARQTGRLADAPAFLREAVELATYAGYRLRLVDLIEESGYWCEAAGQYAAAVTLWASRDALTQAAGLPDTPFEERARKEPRERALRALNPAAVRTAHGRGAAMAPAAAAEFAIMTTGTGLAPTAPAAPSELSARERELVALVAQGLTDAEISGKLFISVSTVRTHLDRIRDKSGCRRRADLTRLALEKGII